MKKIKRITKLSAYIMWNYLVRIPALLILVPVINLVVASGWAAGQLLCFLFIFKFSKDACHPFTLSFIKTKEFWLILKMLVTLKFNKEEN